LSVDEYGRDTDRKQLDPWAVACLLLQHASRCAKEPINQSKHVRC
jgi:hypothetical protein